MNSINKVFEKLKQKRIKIALPFGASRIIHEWVYKESDVKQAESEIQEIDKKKDNSLEATDSLYRNLQKEHLNLNKQNQELKEKIRKRVKELDKEIEILKQKFGFNDETVKITIEYKIKKELNSLLSEKEDIDSATKKSGLEPDASPENNNERK